MKQKEKIAVVGSYAVGMTIVSDYFPEPGETVSGHEFQEMKGGKGSNQAVAAARMGAQVVYGTCVGKDEFGTEALEMYRKENIDATYVRRSKTGMSTGVGLIYVNADGENEIVIDFAANKEYGIEDIEMMMPAIKSCKLLLMQLECSMEIVEYASRRCQEEGIPFILNPAPYDTLSEEILKRCTYLIPNQSEGRQILGLSTDDPITDEMVAERLFEKGAKNVIVTLGSNGVYVKNEHMKVHVEGNSVQAVDTTGAGDTFIGAFCVALAEGKDIVSAVKFGNAAAGIAVTRYGVIDAIPSRQEVESFLRECVD